MERFAPALRRLARELDLPHRSRAPLLLEMAADLEAVYEHHRSRGLSEDEAARRAEEAVLGSSEVIRRLGQLHTSPWRGWTEDVAVRLGGGLDLVLLLAGVVPVLLMAGAVAVGVLAAGGAPLVWGLLAVGALMAGWAGAAASRLRRGRPLESLGFSGLLVLSALGPALGLLASAIGVRDVALGLAASSAPLTQATAARHLATHASALLVGLLLGLAGLLTWSVLVHRDARRAALEVEALIGGELVPPEPTHVTHPLIRRRRA